MPLGSVSDGWPDELKSAISDAGIADSQVTLDLASLEPMMKRGKIGYTWTVADSVGAAQDSAEVSIPLKLVIPHFMSAATPQADQKKVDVDTSIPDVFSKEEIAAKTAQEPAAPDPAPAAEAPAPAPAPEPAAKSAPSGAAPAEIVAQICQLPGVTGALLTMSDGLPVAKELPDGVNGDALSGFVPEIFNRSEQYATASQLGDAASVEVQTGAHLLHIRKSGGAYIAALGKPGADLPSDKLAEIVNAAGRENQ